MQPVDKSTSTRTASQIDLRNTTCWDGFFGRKSAREGKAITPQETTKRSPPTTKKITFKNPFKNITKRQVKKALQLALAGTILTLAVGGFLALCYLSVGVVGIIIAAAFLTGLAVGAAARGKTRLVQVPAPPLHPPLRKDSMN